MRIVSLILFVFILGSVGTATPDSQCLKEASGLGPTKKAESPSPDEPKSIGSFGANAVTYTPDGHTVLSVSDLESAGYKVLQYDFKKGGTSYLHLVEKNGRKFLVKDFENDSYYNNMAKWEGEMLAKLFKGEQRNGFSPFVYGELKTIKGREAIVYDFKENAESLWDADLKKMPYEKKLDIARQILRASEMLHQKGIIHRDIKPGNILIDADGKIYLIDLGLAAPTGGEPMLSIQNGTPARTPGGGTRIYSSPDQIAEASAKPEHDIHSLNKVLVEIFTGTSLVDKKHFMLMHDAFGIRDLGLDRNLRPDELPVIKFAPEDKGLTPQLATAVYSPLARTPAEKWEMIDKADKLKPADFYKYYAALVKRETDRENPNAQPPPTTRQWLVGLVTKKESKPWVAKNVAEDFLSNRGLIERFDDMGLSAEQKDAIILGYFFLDKNRRTRLIQTVPESVPSEFLHYDQFLSKLRYLQQKGKVKPDSYYEKILEDRALKPSAPAPTP